MQLREAGDQDPFLLLGAHLKRELAGEPLYRRALREWGLPGGFPGARRVPGGGMWEVWALRPGQRAPGHHREGVVQGQGAHQGQDSHR